MPSTHVGNKDGDEHLTILETAQFVGKSPNRIRQLVKSGRLPFTATKYGRLVRRSDAERLKEHLARSGQSVADRVERHRKLGRPVTERRNGAAS